MKIATITCHDVYNYGASLQAYALQTYCRSLGADYEIIDYKPPYLSNHFRLDAVANDVFDKPLIKQLYLLAKLPGRLIQLKKKRTFDAFTSQFLNRSDQRYSSVDELKKDCPQADLYIAGSDQIWNTFFSNGRDAAFYLDFVGNRGRKISYAASFATDRIFNNAETFVAKQLRNFDAISVRESSANDLLCTLGHASGTLVADPVFLLNATQWTQLSSSCKKIAEDYILVYDCERSKRLRDLCLHLKHATGLPIYTLSATYGHYADKDFSLDGPLEFINLMANARYVIANSFHATAFSLIFHKDFFIVNRSEAINTRMRDFLQYLGLNSRLISDKAEINTQTIDYTNVTPKLDALIQDSKHFLKTQISSCHTANPAYS